MYKKTVISVCSESEFLPVCAKIMKLGGEEKKKKTRTAAFFQELFTEALCYLVQDARNLLRNVKCKPAHTFKELVIFHEK